MENSDPKFVEVYRARNLPEAHALRIALENAGIRIHIDGELLQGAVGELPMGWVTAPRILVEESQALAARELIQRVDVPETTEPDENEQDEETRCLACGSALDEAEVKCSSCGWSPQNQEEGFQEEGPERIAPAIPVVSPSSGEMSHSRTRGFIIMFVIAVLGLGSGLALWIVTSIEGDFQRGYEAIERKDYEQAISSFTTVIRWEPKNAVAYHNRACAYFEKGEYDMAIADCNQAIQLDPQFPDAYHGRGIAYHGKGEYDMAITNYNIAIQLAPKYYRAYDSRGLAFQKKKEFYKAIDDYNRAIWLHPKFALGYNDLAWLLATCPEAKVRDRVKALEYAKKSCALSDWKEPYFLETLAAAYAENGEFTSAIKYQKRALEFPEYVGEEGEKARQRLKLYEAGKPYREEE